MMGLYEEIVRVDEYRTIGVINSFEQDSHGPGGEMSHRLWLERRAVSLPGRAARFLRRDGFTVREKVGHFREQVRDAKRAAGANRGLDSYCLIGWHSMVIRTTGVVAPCCILQGKELGNVYHQSVREVWHGEAYNRFRAELVPHPARGPGLEARRDRRPDGRLRSAASRTAARSGLSITSRT